MKFRKLRIAFSAACLIACVLLIVLWVRSYRHPWHYQARFDGGWANGTSKDGAFGWETFRIVSASHLMLNKTGHSLPCWLPTTLAAAVAVAPWIRYLDWQFSLRTLLIATTLVAAALGVIVRMW